MIKVIWQPTWEAAELLLANPDFKAYADSYENADTSTHQLNVQYEDQEIEILPSKAVMVVPSTLKTCGTRRKAKASETRQSFTYTDGCAMQDAISKQQIIGAGIFTPLQTPAIVIPSLSILEAAAPHLPSIELNLIAAVLVPVQKGHTKIATDSASSLFQIRKQLLNPMAVLHHLHRELLKVIVNFIQSSPSTATFYIVKSHSGIIGNEGANHLVHKAAVNQN